MKPRPHEVNAEVLIAEFDHRGDRYRLFRLLDDSANTWWDIKDDAPASQKELFERLKNRARQIIRDSESAHVSSFYVKKRAHSHLGSFGFEMDWIPFDGFIVAQRWHSEAAVDDVYGVLPLIASKSLVTFGIALWVLFELCGFSTEDMMRWIRGRWFVDSNPLISPEEIEVAIDRHILYPTEEFVTLDIEPYLLLGTRIPWLWSAEPALELFTKLGWVGARG